MKYSDIRELLDLNKKYPNLFNGKMSYEELHKYLKTDFITMTDIQAKFANVKNHNLITIYGYEFTPEKINEYKQFASEYDTNDVSKEKFDNIVKQIYENYIITVNSK